VRLRRGAIIGCGFFGSIHLEAWRRVPGVKIVAACDPEKGRAEAFAPHAYRIAEEMLHCERLDFVDIATRPETHLNLVSQVAKHGLPAICQKPMAPSCEDAVAMVEVSEAAGVLLMIHENWRWQPWYREAAKAIGTGRLGRPVSYSFRVRKRDGTGLTPYEEQPYFRKMPRLLIYETLVHHIDTARFLFGPIESVFARVRRINPAIRGEDRAILTLSHSSCVDGVIDGHRFSNPEPDGPAMGDAIFECDSGVLRINAKGEIFEDGEMVWKAVHTEGYKGDSVYKTQQHFIDCLATGAPFETSARSYLQTFYAVEAAYRSAETGKAMTLGGMQFDSNREVGYTLNGGD
jgi:predicted dehydrogenase